MPIKQICDECGAEIPGTPVIKMVCPDCEISTKKKEKK